MSSSTLAPGILTEVPTQPSGQHTALRFLRFLFEGLTGGYIEFRYYGPGRKLKVVDPPHYITLPLETESALGEVVRHNGERMIAFSPAPRCRIPGRGSRGKDHDVLAAGCVWASLENRDAEGGVIEVVRRIRDFPLRPSVVVNSGYGYQVYFVLSAPLRAGRLTAWGDLTAGLREALGCDERARLSQVMRLPGTLNVREAYPVPCEVAEEYSSWTRYSTEEIRTAIEKSRGHAPASDTSPTGGTVGRGSAPSVDALRQRGVPQEIINAVITGRNVFRPGGQLDGDSGRDFVIASALYEKGFGPEEIKSVFRNHPRGCGSTWAQRGRGTSTGKSTSLRLVASVYGRPDDPDSLILQWTNTSAAVEQVAWVCGELPVFLDDAQHCPAEVKRSVVYMVANGRGKGRGAGGGGIRETPTWHTVALSTSEEPLHESSPHEGARGRILSVGGLTTPFPQGAAELVQSVERAAAANHGHAGEAFVRHLNAWSESDWLGWQKRYAALRGQLLAGSGSNVVGRVSGYIAAVQLAGEIACPLLGLPFSPEVVGAWLMLHLQEQQGDQNHVLQALRALADYYVANRGRFAGDEGHPGGRAALCGAVKPQQYVGFLRSTVEAVFRARRWGVTAALNKLAAAGALCSTEGDRYTKKVTVGGVKHRMVCVKWSAVFGEGDSR